MLKTVQKCVYIPKELSWLSFNHRVLQEAACPETPLVEKLKFLGIYSSNLDEFFRVRVATLKRMQPFPQKAKKYLGETPQKLQKLLKEILSRQENEFNAIFDAIIGDLRQYDIHLVNAQSISAGQEQYIQQYFKDVVRSQLFPVMLGYAPEMPELRDGSIYMLVVFYQGSRIDSKLYALLELPAQNINRLVLLPQEDKKRCLIFLDDIVRLGMSGIFSSFKYTHAQAYSIKLNRDAELDIEDDLTQSYIKKVSQSLKLRKEGDPVRFIYDSQMPPEALAFLMKKFGLKKQDDLIGSGKYLNHRDLIRFPDFGIKKLRYEPLPPLPHPEIKLDEPILDQIQKKDILLNFPYHSFATLLDLLRECAVNPRVHSIKITVYRLATNSSVINALITAAKNGKMVMVVVELQARFDEENNIRWANLLKDEGVKVVFGFPGLKVHTKLALIHYSQNKKLQRIALLGTGNFNETTAQLYTDHILLTSDKKITSEVEQVFTAFEVHHQVPHFRSLWVAPYNFRQNITRAIEQEISNHQQGIESGIFIKVNNLVDPEIINLLYTAAQKGVSVRLVVRGMFSMGIKKEDCIHLEAISIVDRFLEHSRIFWFTAGGAHSILLSSADLMTRNLDRRLEVAFPIYNFDLKKQVMKFLEIQWADNKKARLIDAEQSNSYKSVQKGSPLVRAQTDWYKILSKNTI